MTKQLTWTGNTSRRVKKAQQKAEAGPAPTETAAILLQEHHWDYPEPTVLLCSTPTARLPREETFTAQRIVRMELPKPGHHPCRSPEEEGQQHRQGHSLFQPLPSGKPLRTTRSRTNRLYERSQISLYTRLMTIKIILFYSIMIEVGVSLCMSLNPKLPLMAGSVIGKHYI